MAVDHVCKKAASNEVTMLHGVTDLEEELEDDSKENFHCFEDEDDIIAIVDYHDKFKDEDFVWESP